MGANEEIRELYAIVRSLERRIRVLERTEYPGSGEEVPPAPTARGDVIAADSTPAWGVLTLGNAHYLLKVNAAGTDPTWEAFDWDAIAAATGADVAHTHQSSGEGGKVDHGAALEGLGDDDHPHYLLADGTRNGATSQRQAFVNGLTVDGNGLVIGAIATAPDGTIWLWDGSSYIYLERGGGGGAGSQGLIVRTASDPASGESIFEVQSSGNAIRLFVAHAGLSYFGDHLAVAKGLVVGNTTTVPDDDDVYIDGSINKSTTLGAAARRTSNQTIGSGSWVAVSFNTEIFDTDDVWSSGSATRFQPNHAGYYLCIGCVVHDSVSGGSYRGAGLRKNGSTILTAAHVDPSGSGLRQLNPSAVVYLDGVSDYVEVIAFQDSGSNQSLYGHATNWNLYGACVRIA